MTEPLTPDLPPNVGVADYFDLHPEEAGSILMAKTPDVLVLARCIGAPKTARYFAARLHAKVTEKMIKTLKSKVTRGVLLVTREELERAALSHPVTAAIYSRDPSLCDPESYRTSIVRRPSHEKEKQAPVARRVKKATTHSTTKEAKSATGPPSAVEKPIEEKEQDPPTRDTDKGAAKAPPSAAMTQEEIEENLQLLDADDQADDEINS